MKPRAPDNLRYQEQRLAAIRAAASVFSEKGYHGASTRDVAERLGIKQGSLYYYFESKQEALEEVCLYGLSQYVRNMDAITASDDTFDAKLFAVVTNHLSSYREKSEALKVHNDERLYLPQQRRKRLKALGTQYREQLEGIIAEGIAAGAVRETVDAHFVAQSVIGICNGLGELIVRDQDAVVFDLARKCTDLLLKGMIEDGRV